MAAGTPAKLRNIAVCGHASAGKTTLIDRLLSDRKSGPAGDVHVCDFDEEEISHGHTIEPTLVHLNHGGVRFNLIDTPGYPDFIGGLVASIAAVDFALVCIDAHSGIGLGARRAMDLAEKQGIGRAIMITKMDDAQADFKKLVHDCRELWGPGVVPVLVPLGQGESLTGVVSAVELPVEAKTAVTNLAHAHEELVDQLIEMDESLMEQYLEGVMPDIATLERLLKQGLADGQIIPLFCSSSTASIGLDESLDLLARVAPSPSQIERTAVDAEGNVVTLQQTDDSPVAAQVFKVRIDPFVQKLSFVRVYGGTLEKDQSIHISGVRKDVKLNPILNVQANKTDPIDVARAGDIVAIAKMEDLHVGTSIGQFKLRKIEFPEPMVGLSISPINHGDENKLSVSMHKLTEEDPTLDLGRDPQTSEMVMTGMSELHLQILRERLARRDKIEINTHDPHIPFRETISKSAEGHYRHKKQSGGRGQFGEVHIRMMPLPRGTEIEKFATKARFPQMKSHHYHPEWNFLWVDSIVGGVIPGNFMPAIEKGFLERLAKGVIAGYPIQNLAIEVHDGKHHPVDSSEAAFKMAGSLCFREVFNQAGPSLLEPIVEMVIAAPEENVGDIYSDISGRGGRVLGSDPVGGGLHSITSEVPLRAISHYSRTLSSMTAGQGSYNVHFSHYEQVPHDVGEKLMEAAKSGTIEEVEI